MASHFFLTSSPAPPDRWREAFPHCIVVNELPGKVPDGTLVWLHNQTPAQMPPEKRFANARFIVLHDVPSDEAGLAALGEGASGYVNAHATPELLQTVASVVGSGGLWVGESLLNRMLGRINQGSPQANKAPEHPLLQSLSEREREVALAVIQGQSNKEIARQLDVAERTIKAHLTSIFEKLGVRDRLRLALLLNTPE